MKLKSEFKPKKKFMTVFLSFFIMLSVNLTAYAYDLPEYIRIGLEYKYLNVSAVSVSNTVVVFGSESLGAFSGEAEISSSSGFSAAIGEGYYVRTNAECRTYGEALEKIAGMDSHGYMLAPAYFGAYLWGVYVYGLSSSAEAESISRIFDGRAVPVSGSTLELRGENTVIISDGVYPQIAAPSGGTVTLGDRAYRGRVEFGKYAGGSITAVNVVGLEEYLYSVVPSEMSVNYSAEALKAQACAARTFTSARINRHSGNGYDLCDKSSCCQLYTGIKSEAVNTSAAVDATKGKVITYNGSPINATYFSSSGGYTDFSENVWVTPVAYFKAVKEVGEYEPKIWTRTFTKSEINSLLSAGGYNIGSVKYIIIDEALSTGRVQKLDIVGTSGTLSLTKEKIRTFFTASSGGALESRLFTLDGEGARTIIQTDVIDSIVRYDESGSIPEMYAVDSSGSTVSVNVNSSYAVNDNEALIALDSIKTVAVSSNAKTVSYGEEGSETASVIKAEGNIEMPSSANSNGNVFVFAGRGYGHGVGMSQKGAEGMARLGYTYKDILEYYYSGAKVE